MTRGICPSESIEASRYGGIMGELSTDTDELLVRVEGHVVVLSLGGADFVEKRSAHFKGDGSLHARESPRSNIKQKWNLAFI